jgi:hypothetical protein
MIASKCCKYVGISLAHFKFYSEGEIFLLWVFKAVCFGKFGMRWIEQNIKVDPIFFLELFLGFLLALE